MSNKKEKPAIVIDIDENNKLSINFNNDKLEERDVQEVLNMLTAPIVSILLTKAQMDGDSLEKMLIKHVYMAANTFIKNLDERKAEGRNVDPDGDAKNFIHASLYNLLSVYPSEDEENLHVRINNAICDTFMESNGIKDRIDRNHWIIIAMLTAIADIIADSIKDGADPRNEIFNTYDILSRSISETIPEVEIAAGITGDADIFEDHHEESRMSLNKSKGKTYLS